MKSILVIHEYGAPEHYAGAKTAAQQWGGELECREFSTLLLTLKRLKSGSVKGALKALSDFCFLVVAFLWPAYLKGRTVILGCAPLDWRLVLLQRCLKHSKIIYHTSWLCWDGSKYPKPTRFFHNYLHGIWQLFLTHQVKHIAAVTPDVKVQLCEYMLVPSASVSVVYHSFDNSIFKPLESLPKVATTKEYKLNLLFVGRLIEEKGIHDLITLAKKMPHCHFTVVGKGRLESTLIVTSKEIANLTLLGFVSDRKKLAAVYQASDLLLQPSKKTKDWEELFGMAIIEAMACGAVPLTSNHVGPKTILSDSEFASNVIAEEDFVDSAYQKTTEYLNDSVQLISHQQVAVKLAETYNLPSIALRWQDIFKGI
jgi:glycosyltransferase involved in cell wall biosynthesis